MVSDGDKLPSGHVISVVKGEDEERLKKNFFVYKDGVIRANPGNWIFPVHFPKFAKLIYDFKLRSSDIVVATYPKSGTTWAEEIIWNLVHNPDLTNPAANVSLDARFPVIEGDMFLATSGAAPPDPEGDAMKMFGHLCPGMDWREGILVHLVSFAPPPRMMKSHLPLCFLPEKLIDTCKVCYVTRDPKDVMTSLYHYMRLLVLWGYTGSLDECVDSIIRDEVPFTPYWTHLKLAWDLRDHPNMCFVYYEDMKSDIEGEIRKIDKFLGTNRTDEQIQNIIKHTSFSSMKERFARNPPTSNEGIYFDKSVSDKEGGFFRKGETGDWKNRFTTKQVEKLDAWIAKNISQLGEDYRYKV